MMAPRSRSALTVLVVALTLAGATRAAPEEPRQPGVRRFVLVVGENDGGPVRPRLRYAGSDAEGFARVMRRLGGVAAEDVFVLLDPGEAALRTALADLHARVGRAHRDGRVEVLFYYSGHSDEEGLLVRGARLPYVELRRWLGGLGADIRIAILDSCASGAATRGKGGARAPPFLLDASARLTGHAILTSSAADEASQESDRIGASFFTHYLLTGLRGAADANQDGRVTLFELYQFAFQETLARTERTRSGPQHPEWDIGLTGAGEVALTDLRGSAAMLVLPAAASGRFFIRDADERLVAELRKVAGRPVELGLEPGAYRVTREAGGVIAEARVDLAQGSHAVLDDSAFTPLSREHTALRGDDARDLSQVPVDLSVFPPVSLNGDRQAENNLQLGLLGSRTTRLRGFGLAPVLWADEDVEGFQLGFVGNSARGAVTGVQLSIIANVAGSLRGLQSTTGLNLVRGDGTGLQGSTLVNWSGGAFSGAQVANFVNYAGSVAGAQVATFVNYAGSVTGAQVGITSLAEQLRGVQLGLVNIGGDTSGAQIGLVNVARHATGLQLGLVNVAERMNGAPLGLISLVRDGEHKLLVLGDESGILSTAILLGSQSFHSLLSVGVQRASGGERLWAGLGFGVHLARGRFVLDSDLLAHRAPNVGTGHLLATARLLGGWQFTPWAALVIGPSLDLFWSQKGFDPGVGTAVGGRFGGSGSGRGWLGVQAGLRLGP